MIYLMKFLLNSAGSAVIFEIKRSKVDTYFDVYCCIANLLQIRETIEIYSDCFSAEPCDLSLPLPDCDVITVHLHPYEKLNGSGEAGEPDDSEADEGEPDDNDGEAGESDESDGGSEAGEPDDSESDSDDGDGGEAEVDICTEKALFLITCLGIVLLSGVVMQYIHS